MSTGNKQKQKKKKRPLPTTVQKSIPYTNVYDNGVFETLPGHFTKAYRLEDVNFKIASEEEQSGIFENYGMFLNTFPSDCRFQILVFNHLADKRRFLNDIRFEPRRDGLNKYRQEINKVIMDKIVTGKNNLQQEKYCVVSVEDNDVGHAMRVLDSMDSVVDKSLRRINPDGHTTPLSVEERLRSLFNIYNQDGDTIFENVVDDEGVAYFDLAQLYRDGATTKEAVAPNGMSFKGNHFTIGETFGRSFFLEKVPTWLTTEYMDELSALPFTSLISVQHSPIEQQQALKLVKNQIVNVNASIAEAEKRAAKDGYSASVISPELRRSQTQANDLMEDLVSRDQKLYNVTMTVTVFASSLANLDEATRQVTSIGSRFSAPLRKMIYQQEPCFNSCLPLCINELSTRKLMTTESASILLPYSSKELHQRNGVLYGLNEVTGSIIMYSRMSGRNYNGLIFGESGSGKSFSAKSEMFNVLLRSDKNHLIIIDPENEYTPMVEALGGEVIHLSSGAKSFVNPLDMDLDYSGDDDPLAMKSDYLISMIEIMYGRGQVITPRERSIIDRCVKNIYRGYLQHLDQLKASGSPVTCDKEAMPTLSNLYNELKMQPETEAQNLADVLELYATGSLAIFAHRSNVEINSPIVSYNIKNLGTGMKDLGLFVCLNDAWNKMIENHKKGIWTWLYIDEFYLLLRSESASAFLMEIWKRARKWQGVPTGIMQNTEDLLRNVNSRNIINNTSFVMMMSLPKFDRDNLAELLQLSDSQVDYLVNAQRGHGLIFNGQTTLPFNNEYPRDSFLYKLMSTSTE